MANMSPATRILASLLCTSALVIMPACSKSSDDAANSFEAGVSKVAKASSLKNIDIPKKRKISNDDAQRALSELALKSSGSGALTWESRAGADGTYTFTNLAKSGGGKKSSLNIKTLKIAGLHMDGDSPAFDMLSLSGVSGHSNHTMQSLAQLTITEPSADLMALIDEILSGDNDFDDGLNLDDAAFKALAIDDLKITDSDKNSKLGISGLRMGKTDASEISSVNVRGINLDIEGAQSVSFSLKSIDATDVKINQYKSIGKALSHSNRDPFDALSGLPITNPYDPQLSSVNLQGFDLNFDGIKANFDHIDVSTKSMSGGLKVTQNISPITILPDGDTKIAKAFKDTLAKMGYDELVVSSKAVTYMDQKTDRIYIGDNHVSLKDGFKLTFDYDLSGLNKYTKALEAQQKDERKGEAVSPKALNEAVMDALVINKFGITFKDNSFTDRAFKLAADQRGTEPEVLKSQMIGVMAMASLAAQDKDQVKLIRDVSRALGDFVRKPNVLKIGLYPETPLSLSELQGLEHGQVDVGKLGFVAEAE